MENLNKEIQIINYYDRIPIGIEEIRNKEEIENKCTIYVNGKEINFTPKYIFKKDGIHKIKIKFKEPLINGKFNFYLLVVIQLKK